jgi:hypothetical protein
VRTAIDESDVGRSRISILVNRIHPTALRNGGHAIGAFADYREVLQTAIWRAPAPGDEWSFLMMTTGTTRIHCTEHPQMVGTLVPVARWPRPKRCDTAHPA